MNYWFNDPSKPQYQGGLCLSDCPKGGGGFYCIPFFHKKERIEEYKKAVESKKFGEVEVPKKTNIFVTFEDIETTEKEKKEIDMEKGDFVIWNNNLPHNGGVNTLPDKWRS